MAGPTELANSSDENEPVDRIPLLHVDCMMALRMLDEEHELPGRCSTSQHIHAGWIGLTDTTSSSRHFRIEETVRLHKP
jgi:hypothetical protein